MNPVGRELTRNWIHHWTVVSGRNGNYGLITLWIRTRTDLTTDKKLVGTECEGSPWDWVGHHQEDGMDTAQGTSDEC